MRRVLCAGAGGFIGGHLVGHLFRQGIEVVAVDVKPFDQWYQHHPVTNRLADLSDLGACRRAVAGCDAVINLAADMGGIGYIEGNKAACMLSVVASTHLLVAARDAAVGRFFYASSACVYPSWRQDAPNIPPLREEEAYPADPEDGYGWEKLFGERMCRHFSEDYGLDTRVARLHNVYGPHGTWDGGREKAPAAICRKVAQALVDGSREIEVWGDGHQTRSFMYVDDCVAGIMRLMASDVADPVNLGSDELVTIQQLVGMVERIAGATLTRRYLLDAPQGVRGRNSDNERIRRLLDWEPPTPLALGLIPTFAWIRTQVESAALRTA